MSTSLAIPYHLCPKCLSFRKGTRCPVCGGIGIYLAEEIDKRGGIAGLSGSSLVGFGFGVASLFARSPGLRDRLRREAAEVFGEWLLRRRDD